MFNLKIAATTGAALFAFMLGNVAVEAATIKKRAGVTYSCTLYKNYEKCRVIKKKKRVKRKINRQVKVETIRQAEWPIFYDTAHIHSVAARFVGLHERVNRDMLQSIIKIDPARIPWCAAFVNAVLGKTGYTKSGSNQARSFLRYGVATREPKKGDIVVLVRHVGIFQEHIYRNGRKFVAVLGGNQSNRVKVSYFTANSVLSYRRAT
jgi:uncharacterized protein (TIGR02594 family)